MEVKINSVGDLEFVDNPNYDADLSTEGCSADCKTVTPGYRCPRAGDPIGPCSKYCGNGIFDGKIDNIG